jgi:hypothetical protein
MTSPSTITPIAVPPNQRIISRFRRPGSSYGEGSTGVTGGGGGTD